MGDFNLLKKGFFSKQSILPPTSEIEDIENLLLQEVDKNIILKGDGQITFEESFQMFDDPVNVPFSIEDTIQFKRYQEYQKLKETKKII